MPEALARMRHDSVLSRPAKKTRPNLAAAVFRRLLSFPMRGYAGAALTAVLTGIVVNALTLQHARHPAPFFAPRPLALAPPSAAPTPTPAPVAAPAAAKPAEPAPASVLPPQRPASLGASASGHRADEIGDILREDAVKDGQKEILAAQNALIKLGYTLHADGVANSATLAALRDFERTHSLPISTDVTPRLLKHLAAAAVGR